MNEDLKRFRQKRCQFCGGSFYELKVEDPKYGIYICRQCNEKTINKRPIEVYSNMLKYNYFKNKDKY